jgi:hypothetical protein
MTHFPQPNATRLIGKCSALDLGPSAPAPNNAKPRLAAPSDAAARSRSITGVPPTRPSSAPGLNIPRRENRDQIASIAATSSSNVATTVVSTRLGSPAA